MRLGGPQSLFGYTARGENPIIALMGTDPNHPAVYQNCISKQGISNWLPYRASRNDEIV